MHKRKLQFPSNCFFLVNKWNTSCLNSLFQDISQNMVRLSLTTYALYAFYIWIWSFSIWPVASHCFCRKWWQQTSLNSLKRAYNWRVSLFFDVLTSLQHGDNKKSQVTCYWDTTRNFYFNFYINYSWLVCVFVALYWSSSIVPILYPTSLIITMNIL